MATANRNDDEMISGLWPWRRTGVPSLYFIDEFNSYLHAMNVTQSVMEKLFIRLSWPHCNLSLCKKPQFHKAGGGQGKYAASAHRLVMPQLRSV
jgi:hypothetical protein